MPNPSYLTTINGVDALVLRDQGGGDFLYIDWFEEGEPQQSNLLDNRGCELLHLLLQRLMYQLNHQL